MHEPNAIEAIFYFIIMASNLAQLFLYRRLRSFVKNSMTQKEIVRLLIKGLHQLEYDNQYVFSSG